MKEKIKIFLELVKFRITFFVMITTGFGYISASDQYDSNLLFVLLGTLILAFGSAALNQYQERNTDSLMDRTKSRPIPAGKISENNALILSFLLIVSGSIILILGVNLLAFAFGILNLFWYNFIYTPLKRKTALAIIPGSLVGAIPPIIGWVAANGDLFDFRIIVISFFFFIWQIPHFWILLLKLDKDYQLAKFPTITSNFSKQQLARIIFSWTVATGLCSILIPLSLKLTNTLTMSLIISLVLFIIFSSIKLLKFSENNFSTISSFRTINLFVLSVIIVISINKMVF
ncbi:MAG: heme o synthase [Ignavibacterium sp.]|nr:heme o synthase [Ignavibacterium sp.]MCX7612216.1 heme o synthase [Ignavibacterium sp.]MDW8375100.1 heme o synthase [Ignavibacteriales bacterium]